MELTIELALKKGVEAHKLGKIQKADQLYTAILEKLPDHPDANHNMGVLAVGVGKVEQALPFFLRAIKASPSIEQYWLSYIDALIRVNRTGDAKVAIHQAKEAGIISDVLPALPDLRESQSETLDKQKQIEPLLTKKHIQPLLERFHRGEFQEALDHAQRILSKFPKSAFLQNFMGIANAGLENFDLATYHLKRAIAINAGYSEAYFNLGLVLKSVMNFDGAIESFRRALEVKPDYADAYLNLGKILEDLADLPEAMECYENALSINPEFFEALLNTGNIHNARGNYDEAILIYHRAIAVNQNSVQAFSNLGSALRKRGDLNAAKENYNRAIKINPDHSEAHNNLGNLFQEQGDSNAALSSYKQAIKISPKYATAYANMGKVFCDRGDIDDAINSYAQALTIEPNNSEFHLNLGVSYSKNGDDQTAIQNYQKALSLKPDYLDCLLNLGVAYSNLGYKHKAQKTYETALKLDPLCIKAHRSLSALKKYTDQDSQFIAMQQLWITLRMKGEDLSEGEHLSQLAFALAKAYEDCGKFKEAFFYLKKANKLKQEILQYDIALDRQRLKQTIDINPLIKSLSLDSTEIIQSIIPIFIIGMPRSGTTLLGQIVSSHSNVIGAGELPHIENLYEHIFKDTFQYSKENLLSFRNNYLIEIKKRSNGHLGVIDKMPLNFRYISLICAAFPEAKIIHVKRDSAATCWSNFKQYFADETLGYSYDLNNIVNYYKLYTELMVFWRVQYQDRIYEVNYDNLTINQEHEIRLLISYLDLHWEQNCLYPEKNKDVVQTASNIQVREKIYKGSSEQWRNFKPFINGKLDEF